MHICKAQYAVLKISLKVKGHTLQSDIHEDHSLEKIYMYFLNMRVSEKQTNQQPRIRLNYQDAIVKNKNTMWIYMYAVIHVLPSVKIWKLSRESKTQELPWHACAVTHLVNRCTVAEHPEPSPGSWCGTCIHVHLVHISMMLCNRFPGPCKPWKLSRESKTQKLPWHACAVTHLVNRRTHGYRISWTITRFLIRYMYTRTPSSHFYGVLQPISRSVCIRAVPVWRWAVHSLFWGMQWKLWLCRSDGRNTLRPK